MKSAATAFAESAVEDVAPKWLGSLGWDIAYGPGIALDTPTAERTD